MNTRRIRMVLFLVSLAFLPQMPSAMDVPDAEGSPPWDTVEFTLGDQFTSEDLATPSDGTMWVNYWPGPPPVSLVQDGYLDDGDGVISVGDTVSLNSVLYPITLVEPALWTRAFYRTYDEDGHIVELPRGDQLVFFPDSLVIGPPLVVYGWWTVYDLDETIPMLYGPQETWTMDFIYDNNDNGEVDAGDTLAHNPAAPGGYVWHIDLVTVIIQADGFEAVGIEPKSWGALKRLYE